MCYIPITIYFITRSLYFESPSPISLSLVFISVLCHFIFDQLQYCPNWSKRTAPSTNLTCMQRSAGFLRGLKHPCVTHKVLLLWACCFSMMISHTPPGCANPATPSVYTLVSTTFAPCAWNASCLCLFLFTLHTYNIFLHISSCGIKSTVNLNPNYYLC